KNTLVTALRDPSLNVRERQLITAAAQRKWQITSAHQTLLEQLIERRQPSLGQEIEDLDELLERRTERAERLTAAGFQDPLTGDFTTPEDEDEPAPGPMWAAYYPNARNRFGLYDPLSDLKEGEGPVSYAVVGWYLDPDDDPLYAAGTATSRRQFLEACSWDYKAPKTVRHPGVFERLPRVRELDKYINEIEQLIAKINPEEIINELVPGDMRNPGNIDPVPGGIIDRFPELPIDVLDAGNRQPDVIRFGEEAFDLVVGEGRELTKVLSERVQADAMKQDMRGNQARMGKQAGPRMLGGVSPVDARKVMINQRADLLRNRQALLEQRRAQALQQREELQRQQELKQQE
ncbi:MAG: hypothetical protein KC431_20855, partial [Myxococcales bacterium]|nr:hypothetical protein [Myxococcales bacterium]